jgi:hypothetical protein
VGAGIAIRNVLEGGGEERAAPPCRITGGPRVYTLDLEQAVNATTIAAVGKRLEMPNHAVTIALATAYLESGLRNLDHGDRDSLGLFQQRPSQGWGTPAQIMTPHYAAARFYQRLARVRNWQILAVTDAAQRVQRSALPGGYAHFEAEARALARATTGEVPAALSCRVGIPAARPAASLQQAMTQELGGRGVGVPVTAQRGWNVATWLVAHAVEHRITSVSFGGVRWTPDSGTWTPDGTSGTEVQLTRTPIATAVG